MNNTGDKTAKIVSIKFITLILASVSVILMFISVYKIGFLVKDESSEYLKNVYLNDLTGLTSGLMLSGVILGPIALGIILVSTFFSWWISFDRIFWNIGLFVMLIGVILLASGGGYFIISNEAVSTLNVFPFFYLLLPGLLTVAIGLVYFIKAKKTAKNLSSENGIKKNEIKSQKKVQVTKNKNDRLKRLHQKEIGDQGINEQGIVIKQVNSKFRLFLFIIFNWYITIWFFLVVPLFFIIGWSGVTQIVVHIVLFLPLLIHMALIFAVGIEYPKATNLDVQYLKKNEHQLKKINDIKIDNINQDFDVLPICDDIDSEKKQVVSRIEFGYLSQTEFSSNRLVVNGKINDADFSWGVVSRVEKNTIKTFFLAILYFGPIIGLFLGSNPGFFVNGAFPPSSATYRIKYARFGGVDLFPYNVGRLNSENYLVFSAEFHNHSDSIKLIPKDSDDSVSNLAEQYDWPKTFSTIQKNELQNLLQGMAFLPSIYIDQGKISIIMKRYHYNVKDNQELQTWELLRKQGSNNEIQFTHLNNAIKIYHWFNANSFANKNSSVLTVDNI